MSATRVTAKIQELHQRNGCPSSRAVAYRTDGQVSHTTVAYLLSGKSCPRWPALAAVAQALRCKSEDLRELRLLWEAEWEERKALRAQKRPPRIREGVVIRPGDTVLITVEDMPGTDQERWVKTIADQFPDNNVKVIVGANVAVIRAEQEVAA